jgi:hypothetical protein
MQRYVTDDTELQILRQVEAKTLMELVKTSKKFSRLLLSSEYRSIWEYRRIQRGISKITDADELWFAVKVYGRTCEVSPRLRDFK